MKLKAFLIFSTVMLGALAISPSVNALCTNCENGCWSAAACKGKQPGKYCGQGDHLTDYKCKEIKSCEEGGECCGCVPTSDYGSNVDSSAKQDNK